jgi:hypothetical protein
VVAARDRADSLDGIFFPADRRHILFGILAL